MLQTHQWYQSHLYAYLVCTIRTHGDVGVDNHVIAIFCILDHSNIVGLNLPETNITGPRSRDLSHT
jgi:hypothetical protein